MPVAFDENLSLLQPLFKDRFDEAFYEIECQLKAQYDTGHLTEKEDIQITFVLGGALHTLRILKFEKGYSNELLAEIVSAMIRGSLNA